MGEAGARCGETALPKPARLDDARRGILLALAAAALFTTMDSCIKLLTARYHTFQIVAINSALAACLGTALALGQGGVAALRTRRLGQHVMRGCGVLVTACLGFFAYAHMPLADAYAILFSMPLIITALAVPLLGERVGWQRWAAVATGFVGVLIILWPGAGGIEIAALAALGNAVIASCTLLAVRLMRGETPESFVIYGNATVAVGASMSLPFVWVAPDLADAALFLAAGTAAALAFSCIARAYQSAPASIVAPFQYSQMLYAIIVGAVLFGTLPDERVLIGAALVIGCGLYLLQQQARGGSARP
jgi:drug/metabolite transporter (DMT)-like permease